MALHSFCAKCRAAAPLHSQARIAFATHHALDRYNPKRFSAVTIRLREPKTTALVFESGKMVITGASRHLSASVARLTPPCAGAKSEDQALAAAKKYTRLIQRVGHPEATVVRPSCAAAAALPALTSRLRFTSACTTCWRHAASTFPSASTPSTTSTRSWGQSALPLSLLLTAVWRAFTGRQVRAGGVSRCHLQHERTESYRSYFRVRPVRSRPSPTCMRRHFLSRVTSPQNHLHGCKEPLGLEFGL